MKKRSFAQVVGAVPAPFYTYVHYHREKWTDYGDERLQWKFAHRSFPDHGMPVAGAYDCILGPFEPLMAIQSMVTRKDISGRVSGSNQHLSELEALKVCTINGAFASFEEDRKGCITPGKLADFVILSDDPHDVDPDTITQIQILRTVLGGRTPFATRKDD